MNGEPKVAYVPVLKCSQCGKLLSPNDRECSSCGGHLLIDGLRDSSEKFYIANGATPIEQKFLDIGDIIRMNFRDESIYGRIKTKTDLRYRPYRVIDYVGCSIEIDSNSHQYELRLRDPLDRDRSLIYLDEDISAYPHRGLGNLLHGSVGISPSYVQMYMRFPESKWITNSVPDRVTRPDKGDIVGSITSSDSPYLCPTDAAEIWIPPKTHVGFEFYNKSEYTVCPVLNLRFVLYQFEFLSSDDEITRIVPFEGYNWGINSPHEWVNR